jgi:hypothetical protein
VALIPSVAPDQGFPSGPVRLDRNPETDPADGSLLRSEGETWEPVSPDNVHETGVSFRWRSGSHRDRRGGAGRANSKKDLVMGPIEVKGAFIAINGLTS